MTARRTSTRITTSRSSAQHDDAHLAGGAPPDVPPWRGRFVLYAAGAGLLAFGLRGIARDVNGWTHPTYWGPVLVLFALAHDLVLVPLVFAVAVPLGRLVRGAARPYLAAGLALSGVSLALSWPALRGYGRLPDNPSVLPLDYAAGLRSTLLVLWLVLLGAFLVHALRSELSLSRSSKLDVTPRPAPAPTTTTISSGGSHADDTRPVRDDAPEPPSPAQPHQT